MTSAEIPKVDNLISHTLFSKVRLILCATYTMLHTLYAHVCKIEFKLIKHS